MNIDNNKKVAQIHIRVDQETRSNWLFICEHLKGSTQTAIFKNLVSQIYSTIKDMYDIKSYLDAEEE